jgi:hypothetical protein
MCCGTGDGIPSASVAVSGQSVGRLGGIAAFHLSVAPIGGEPPEDLLFDRRAGNTPQAPTPACNFRLAGPDGDAPTLPPRKRKSNVNNVLNDSGKGLPAIRA